MSRAELAEAVNAYLWQVHGQRVRLDGKYIGTLERGQHRWPKELYREAFRAVLGVPSDAELGFYIIKGGPTWAPATSADMFRAIPAPTVTDTRSGVHPETAMEGDVRRRDLLKLGEASRAAFVEDVGAAAQVVTDSLDDELDALELARRVAATDVSGETLIRMEGMVDELAVGYATTPAVDLMPRVRRHLAYVGRLMEGRAALAQRRRLLVVGAWLSLIRATLDTDLNNDVAARSWLDTCRQMAAEAEHAELRAWCLETRAWGLLGEGDFGRAVELAQAAQQAAPRGSSAAIQATAQEGRAMARLSDPAGTRGVLKRIEKMVAALPMPHRPEHHYRYDPGKATAYTATTLAWVGDPAAVDYAREVADRMEHPDQGPRRPRRAAIARLDLALALLAAKQPEEASAAALEAISARMLVASNWWRATEVVRGVERFGIRDGAELRDAYETFRPAQRRGTGLGSGHARP